MSVLRFRYPSIVFSFRDQQHVWCERPSSITKKDPLPVKLRSGVVYMFARVGCNACYVDGTVRHISTRVKRAFI